MSVLPPQVRHILEDAEEAITGFRRGRGVSSTLFVPADHVEVFQALQKVAQPGDTFLEWGSGVGGITILADFLGFEAFGIEIEPDLVELARELAERHGSGAKFATGSFVPSDFDWSTEHADGDFHTDPSGGDGYELLDVSPADFDVIYAYPWPGEENFLRDIFDDFARPGALFLTYNGLNGIQTFRKPLLVRE